MAKLGVKARRTGISVESRAPNETSSARSGGFWVHPTLAEIQCANANEEQLLALVIVVGEAGWFMLIWPAARSRREQLSERVEHGISRCKIQLAKPFDQPHFVHRA